MYIISEEARSGGVGESENGRNKQNNKLETEHQGKWNTLRVKANTVQQQIPIPANYRKSIDLILKRNTSSGPSDVSRPLVITHRDLTFATVLVTFLGESECHSSEQWRRHTHSHTYPHIHSNAHTHI